MHRHLRRQSDPKLVAATINNLDLFHFQFVSQFYPLRGKGKQLTCLM